MSYKMPKRERLRDKVVASVMFRIPIDILNRVWMRKSDAQLFEYCNGAPYFRWPPLLFDGYRHLHIHPGEENDFIDLGELCKPSEMSMHVAAQCWCDEETSGIQMDMRLAMAFAKRLHGIIEVIAELAKANAELLKALKAITQIVAKDPTSEELEAVLLCEKALAKYGGGGGK